ncbi:MAG: hypothetical protein GXO83_02450 [Chlorobi bacterium]|nr:hypothetical protein [Chlorobiota bacterium]
MAERFIQIYRIIDPDNPDAWYLSAVLHAETGNAGQVITELQRAVDKGFNDYRQIVGEKSFSAFVDNRKFQKILKEIK